MDGGLIFDCDGSEWERMGVYYHHCDNHVTSEMKAATLHSSEPVEALTRGVLYLFNRFSQNPNEQVGVHLLNSSASSSLQTQTVELKQTVDERMRSYKEFIGKLKEISSENPDLLKRIGDFLDYVNNKPLENKYPIFEEEDMPGSHEEFSVEIRNFINQQFRDLCSTRFWRNLSETDAVTLKENLERLIMSKVHDKLFAPTPSHKERDEQLSLKIRKLSRVVDPVKNLDMKPTLIGDDPSLWDRPGEELDKMSLCKTPREKMICLTNCCRAIIQLIKNNQETPIPDVFIPCLVYVIIRTNPKSLHSNIEYLAAYRHPDFMLDERGHYFLHLASAAGFLWRADHTALSMTQEEFDEALGLDISANTIPSLDWFSERFRFENVDFSNFKVSEVSVLLEEYKLLVQVCREFLINKAQDQ